MGGSSDTATEEYQVSPRFGTLSFHGLLESYLYFGVDLQRERRSSISLQFNVENVTNWVFRIAKESEFTPV